MPQRLPALSVGGEIYGRSTVGPGSSEAVDPECGPCHDGNARVPWLPPSTAFHARST
jgi:hypothetical protein